MGLSHVTSTNVIITLRFVVTLCLVDMVSLLIVGVTITTTGASVLLTVTIVVSMLKNVILVCVFVVDASMAGSLPYRARTG